VPIKDPVLRREMQKIYSQRWYQRNQKQQVAKNLKRKDSVRKLWNEYKAAQKCSHCGFQHPAVIDFHHIIKEGKKSVNKLATQRSNLKAAIREAEEKCIPLCSNCHRILHWQEHKQRRKKRKWKSKTTS
jgi:predicted RNA-binding Zn-ribbon protein involved in translation (DUF1610 family)